MGQEQMPKPPREPGKVPPPGTLPELPQSIFILETDRLKHRPLRWRWRWLKFLR